jgi:N utilization substance protein A
MRQSSMNKDLIAIFEYLERERGINRKLIVDAITDSLLLAVKKVIPNNPNITVDINPKTGEIDLFCEKEIVENVSDGNLQISLEQAQEIDPEAQVGQFLDLPIITEELGRIAAQKARQAIAERLRAAEKEVIYQEYRGRAGELLSGTVKQFGKGNSIIVDLGKVEGVIPSKHYLRSETPKIGSRIRAVLLEVRDTIGGGAEVILSRTDTSFVTALMEQEVPELAEGNIALHKAVRAAGYRTKIAVSAKDFRLDPIGACIGVRGNRIKNVLRELSNEKIDVVNFSEDPLKQLEYSLHPLVLRRVRWEGEGSPIIAVVDDQDFPAAVGKGGVNTRLNEKLIGYPIQIWKLSEYMRFTTEAPQINIDIDNAIYQVPISSLTEINPFVLEQLLEAGYDTPKAVLSVSTDELCRTAGITLEVAERVHSEIRKQRL